MALRSGYYGIKKKYARAINRGEGGGGGSGSNIKTYTYTGTGTASHTVSLPNDFSEIYGIVENGRHASNRFTGYLNGFFKGSYSAVASWRDFNSAYLTNALGCVSIGYTDNDNEFTINGQDAGITMNSDGVEFTVYYR